MSLNKQYYIIYPIHEYEYYNLANLRKINNIDTILYTK